jgi:transcriptional regulator
MTQPHHSLYNPQHFSSTDWTLACTLLREHALASVVSVNEQGLPLVTHVPLHTTAASTAQDWRLLGHFANANPHCGLLRTQMQTHTQTQMQTDTCPQAVVTVMGPQAYMSPTVYADVQRVPTWNYVVLHAQVRVRLLEEAEHKDQLLKQLIGDHEPGYAQQWRDLPESYTQAMLRAITGFELTVQSWQLKIKVNQHRPEAAAALAQQAAVGSPNEQALAVWTQRWHDSRAK